MSAPNPTPEQRWVKPFPTEPGHWKKQLPTKTLALAVKGDIGGLRTLLDEHPELLNKGGPHGRTLLWEAARRGNLEAVEWLVAGGADVMATGCYNGESVVQLTPYCAATYYRRASIASALDLAGGGQLDIFRAAFMGDAEAVRAALDTDTTLLNAEDPHDQIYYTPLLAFAVAGGQLEVAAELVLRGAEVARYSAQLLRIALTTRRRDVVELLLGHGLDVRTADSGIFQISDDLDLLRELLGRGAPANQAGANDFPPLVFLARGDKGEHPEKLALLLDHGADVNAKGKDGRTALHYAAAVGHEQVVRLLLEHNADRDVRDDAGRTPREVAVMKGRVAVAAILQ